MPPARDEESETQRKAHAKRVRETRRSTQGVTLEEIKSAEELVKKKNLNNNNNNNNANSNNNNSGNNVSKIALNMRIRHFAYGSFVIDHSSKTEKSFPYIIE